MHFAWALLFSIVVANLVGIKVPISLILCLPLAFRPKLYLFIVFLVATWYFVPGSAWLFLLGVMIGFDLPDIDTTKSWIGHRSLGFSFLLERFVSHRGISHSLPLLCVLEVILVSLGTPSMLYEGIGLSYLSHVLGDMLYDPGENGRHSPGVQLLWPMKKRFRFFIFYKHPYMASVAAVVVPIVIIVMSDWK